MGVSADHARLITRSVLLLVAAVAAVLWSLLGVMPSTPAATAEPTPPYVFIYHFSQSAKQWLPGSALPSSARASTPIGTTFSYTADNPLGGAHLEANFDFWRIATGRRVGKKCVPLTKANRGRPRCERRIGAGRLTRSAHEGRNTVHIEGRLNRRRTLIPGRYEVELFLSTTDYGDSDSQFLRFSILRPAGGNG